MGHRRRARGKITRLALLVYLHGEPLEADFARFYPPGDDLCGLWTGALSLRRAAVLADWLPQGSSTWVAVGVDVAWTSTDHLLASLFDAVQIGNWQRAGGKGSKPKAAPRPGDTLRAEVEGAKIEAKARAFMARQEARARAAAARAEG